MKENFQIFENQVNFKCNVRVVRKTSTCTYTIMALQLDIMHMESFFVKNNTRVDVDLKYVHALALFTKLFRTLKLFPQEYFLL